MRYLLFLFLFFREIPVFAQEANLENNNYIYDSDIRSAQLLLEGGSLLLPIVDLNAANYVLRLQFDHLGEDIMDYSYVLIHCNSDWQPSELDESQYISGYAENRIDSILVSQGTILDYTHYFVKLPNSNVHWTKSGNYLLKVIDNANDRQVVLMRRFLVVEPQWSIEPKFVQAADVAKLHTHQEIDLNVNFKSSIVRAPMTDVKIFILQNSRWDNSIGPVAPRGTSGNLAQFDYQDKLVFPAGLEFRDFDIRTLDFKGDFIKRIDRFPDRIEVTLKTDRSRYASQLNSRLDVNGRYLIDNTTVNRSLLQSEYCKVLFSISQNAPLEDEDVYIFGELTDWDLKPEFKMEYSEEAKAYYCETLLKQGYYNYMYQVVDRNTGRPSDHGFEGNWFETGNKYTILAYYRPFNTRYDRLMATITIDTKP